MAGKEHGRGIEREIGKLLVAGGNTVAVAESCTGGLLGARITSISGSSRYFTGGIIAYSNEAKTRILGVSGTTLDRCGAVSREVAGQMASGVMKNLKSDVGIAITGIAGPDGGTAGKPVGLVYIGLAWKNGRMARKFLFLGGRERIRESAVESAMDILRKHIKKQGVSHGKETRREG